MDGVISFPVGVACFYFLPDSPDNSRSHYFSTEASDDLITPSIVYISNVLAFIGNRIGPAANASGRTSTATTFYLEKTEGGSDLMAYIPAQFVLRVSEVEVPHAESPSSLSGSQLPEWYQRNTYLPPILEVSQESKVYRQPDQPIPIWCVCRTNCLCPGICLGVGRRAAWRSMAGSFFRGCESTTSTLSLYRVLKLTTIPLDY